MPTAVTAMNPEEFLVAGLGELRYDTPLADYVADRHVPIKLAISERNQVAPDGDLWLSVLESTAQPMNMLEAGG